MAQPHVAIDDFPAIFARYYPQVCRFFMRRAIPPEDARELAQDVFFSVYRNLTTIADESHFTAWLFTIARNTLVNELERRHARKRSGVHVVIENDAGTQDMDILPSNDTKDALQSILDREKMEKLAAALEDLPAQMKRCVQLRVTSESSYEEIAAVMGLSVNTVKAHLHKARKLLQRKLSPYFSDLGALGREEG